MLDDVSIFAVAADRALCSEVLIGTATTALTHSQRWDSLRIKQTDFAAGTILGRSPQE
ncbi:MAG: hypothetical protein AAF732_13010 [Pseudomonadota bacterium]